MTGGRIELWRPVGLRKSGVRCFKSVKSSHDEDRGESKNVRLLRRDAWLGGWILEGAPIENRSFFAFREAVLVVIGFTK